jgi:hypothetical protein
LLKDFYSVRITKTQFFSVRINLFKIFLVLSCQNISSSVGMTKSRAFAPKSCQNISSFVGMTKSRAFAQNLVKTFVAL